MAGNIKGITIEFRGDTTQLDKSLRAINKETRAIDQELKKVDKALKFNPTNVELWRQKQDLLKQKIGETKEKLDVLKDAQKQMDASGVDKNSEEYRKLQREIIETESKLKTFESQQRKIGQVNLRAASEQFKDMGNKLTAAGSAMKGLSTAAAAVLASMGAITVKSGKWADDVNTLSKKYHIGTEELQKYSAAADLVDVDVDTIAKSHVRLTKAMSGSEDETGAQAEAFEKLGISVTDANGNLRDADTVWQETIAALGEVENETERDALAMTLMGKSAADLNPLIEDGGEAYKQLSDTLAKYDLDFIDKETLDKANDFNDQLDTIKAIGTVALQQVGTQLASALAPALEKVVDLVGRLAKWFTSLSPKTQAIIAGIAGVVAIAAPLLLGLGKLSFAISSILSLMATLGPAIGGIISALGPIVLVIAAVIAAGVLLYKNWDKIKAKALELKTKVTTTFKNLKTQILNIWNGIKERVRSTVQGMIDSVIGKFTTFKTNVSKKFQAIKESITGPIEKAKELVTAAIDKIKGIFPIQLGKIFSGIKLPHFKISGGKIPWGIGGEGEAPSVNIEWYKRGGIFDNPTLIGIGEAGPEAVVPLDKLWDKLDNIAAGSGVVINVYGSANMSVNELAAAVEARIIQLQKRRSLAWQ